MELTNETPYSAAFSLGMDKHAREHLVVVAKATFTLPLDGAEATLTDAQCPVFTADVYDGEPGLSAPRYESDFAPCKRHCDVTLIGSAYAPGGRPVASLNVGLSVGAVRKVFTVMGSRFWIGRQESIEISDPQPFAVKPISYELAFGGIDRTHDDPARHDACYANPVGRGYFAQPSAERVHGMPVPCTQEVDRAVIRPDGDYRPMSFGPVGRSWQPRAGFAGTYNKSWLDECFPFLPRDFDEAYYQCAPPDQQTPFLLGGEEVQLYNLTRQGMTRFKLPSAAVAVAVERRDGTRQALAPVMDTLVIEPDAGRFTMSWRAGLPLIDNVFEIVRIFVSDGAGGGALADGAPQDQPARERVADNERRAGDGATS